MDTVAASFATGAASSGTAQGITAASILSGTTQALGGLMRERAQRAEAASAEAQADLTDIRAEREQLRGRQAAGNIRQELLRNVSSQIAAGSASGLAFGSGVLTRGVEASVAAGQREVRIARGRGRTRASAERLRGFRLRREAAARRAAGRSEAVIGLLSGFSSIARRGTVPDDAAGGASLGVREAGAFD